MVAKVRPEAASVHWLLINSLVAVIGMVLSGAIAVVDMKPSSLPAPLGVRDTALVYAPLSADSRPIPRSRIPEADTPSCGPREIWRFTMAVELQVC
jgi:hypothetical protein